MAVARQRQRSTPTLRASRMSSHGWAVTPPFRQGWQPSVQDGLTPGERRPSVRPGGVRKPPNTARVPVRLSRWRARRCRWGPGRHRPHQQILHRLPQTISSSRLPSPRLWRRSWRSTRSSGPSFAEAAERQLRLAGWSTDSARPLSTEPVRRKAGLPWCIAVSCVPPRAGRVEPSPRSRRRRTAFAGTS